MGCVPQSDVTVEIKQRLVSKEVGWMATEKEDGGTKNLNHGEMLVKNI